MFYFMRFLSALSNRLVVELPGCATESINLARSRFYFRLINVIHSFVPLK